MSGTDDPVDTTAAPSQSAEAPEPTMAPVRAYFEALQDRICSALVELDGTPFDARELVNERGGSSRPRVLSDGPVFERAAVHTTFASGSSLPPAATDRRPALAGRGFATAAISLIVHPRNPHVPTTHANLRFFIAHDRRSDAAPVWWFGGGFDLTPTYGYDEDVLHWHRCAQAAVEPFGDDLYDRFKRQCDEYFHLPHRDEPRGVGGLFYDDLDELPPKGDCGPPRKRRRCTAFESCFALTQSVGDHFLPAYRPLVERRVETPYGERERTFQLIRRGRYVEFNLAWDRGTRYGLQVGARAESLLSSMPPKVIWRYDWKPERGSAEERLTTHFLKPRDWLAEATAEA